MAKQPIFRCMICFSEVGGTSYKGKAETLTHAIKPFSEDFLPALKYILILTVSSFNLAENKFLTKKVLFWLITEYFI